MCHPTRTKKASKSSTEDRISALPDNVLQHVVGFLPAVDLVHTSALARRWRYLWKSTRRLRIDYLPDDEEGSSDDFINKFINCLLLLRDPSCTLDEVKLHCSLWENGEYVDIWIRHALLCHAQMLSIYIRSHEYHRLDGRTLVSRHLRRLELRYMHLDNSLNFSSCPALDDLKIIDCEIATSRIFSQSVKHLIIEDCSFESAKGVQKHVVSFPNLISLQFIPSCGTVPLIESMQSLETAVASIDEDFGDDYCSEGVDEECCGTCAVCCGNGDQGDCCIFLGVLSSATNLELVAPSNSLIFRRDLRWCPTFSKLKSLLLSEWCAQIDLGGLVCMLEHSPVLENLFLTFCKQGEAARTLEVEVNNSLMQKPASISGYLKSIKIECEEVDGRVCKVLKFLSILDMEIIVKRTNR